MKKLLTVLSFLVGLGLAAPVLAQSLSTIKPITASGTLSAADAGTCSSTSTACVVMLPGGYSSVSVQVTGNAMANTLQFEMTLDPAPSASSVWVALNLTPPNSATPVTSTTSTGVWTGPLNGAAVRVRMSTLVGGTAVVQMRSTFAAVARTFPGGSVTSPVLLPDGTGAAPSLAFTNNTGIGLWRPASGVLGVASTNTRFTDAAFNNGSSNRATEYANIQPNNWGTEGGAYFYCRNVAVPTNGSCTLEGWLRDSTWPSVQLSAAYQNSANGLGQIPVGAYVLWVCSTVGSTPCDFQYLEMTGNGAIEHNVYTGSNLNTPGGAVTTSYDGYLMQTPYTATSTITSAISPRFKWRGVAWTGAASQTVDFFAENLPTSAATPTGLWKLGYSLNGAAASYPLTVSSAGSATALTTFNATTGYLLGNVLAESATAPTIASGGCSSPSIGSNNGTAAFVVTIGSSCTGVKTVTLTFPAAAHFWACTGNNNTSDAAQQTNYPVALATNTTTVVIKSYDRTTNVPEDFTAADSYLMHCTAE